MDYPQCRRRRGGRRGKSPCEGDKPANSRKTSFPDNEFPIRNIIAKANTQPAGGANIEFIDPSGKPCDALNMKKNCKPATAGNRQGGALIEYLSRFCDTPASLYQVPVGIKDFAVPADFGAVTYPMPICSPAHKKNCTNFRAKARADFGSFRKGTWLQCQTKSCREGSKQSAAQGVFNEDLDVYVSSKSPSDAYTRPWYPMIGGQDDGTNGKPSAVTKKWTHMGSAESGLFNQDVLANHWDKGDDNSGAKYAINMVKAEKKRLDGVTCLNGKFVYAREFQKKWSFHRPIVSTVREALNRNGPVATNGQWACRYLGVHCNANNCNNNGNGEVAGPFIVPKITTTTTTGFGR